MQNRPTELTTQFLHAVEQDFARLLAGQLDELPHIHGYAARLGVHPTHLSNTVHAETGHSPCDYINHRYLQEARQLLRHTQQPIGEVAFRLGFQDASNFAKYFKRHTGLTPTQFRAQPD